MKKLKKISFFISFFLITSCVSSEKVLFIDAKHDVDVNSSTEENEVFSQIQCYRKILDRGDITDNRGFVLFVSRFVDGSTPSTSQNGPLMDRADMLFQYYLKIGIPETMALMIDEKPLIYVHNNSGTTGINKYGIIEKGDQEKFYEFSKNELYRNRLKKGKAFADSLEEKLIRVYDIEAAFTRNDKDDFYGSTNSLNSGYYSNKKSGNSNFSFGENQKTMGLTVKIINANNGLIKYIESFRILFDTKRKRYSITAGLSHFKLTASYTDKQIESLDSVQNALVRSAALWTISRIFSSPNKTYDRRFIQECVNKGK